ncbi:MULTISPECIES: hypothetical protein [unclassified Leptolyngbya]|uniref:hypothetical protein n=1 Tax=unclassified Leptolyngbya TaxID=2650499 RepID=UPI001686EFEA|nr:MULTISPECIES: hypothetical protein [unclassified Leptolyngbya]MBD1912361.1 hypothetical protein [Leptolyngbya sp. FACHB-8]MBD2158003.1 hypothetical protein [Leptolyngbya sp. FACHB-16]
MFELTLDETLAQQENLESLCQECPEGNVEIFHGNAFYGGDRILKTYANLPPDYALKGVVPHGVYLSDTFIWHKEIFSPLPAAFYFSEHLQKNYENNLKKQHVHKRLYPLSSPFLYLLDLYKNAPKPERDGTLFFLTHSTHHITTAFDPQVVIDKLHALEQRYHPVTICLYWRDFQLGCQKPFEAAGFRVVSAGHMYDPLFMARLYHLLSLHRYAAGNDISSHVFYAVKTGCPYLYIDTGNVTRSAADPKRLALTLATLDEPRIQKIKSLFQEPSDSITPAQLELVDYYLGAQYFQSPEGLKQQFLDLEPLYELGYNTPHYFQVSSPELSAQLDEVPSEVSAKERRFLYNYFAKFWPGNEDVFEIGPFLGGTSRAIALGMAANPQRNPETKFYTCDRFDEYYDPQQLSNFLQTSFEEGRLPADLKATVETSTSFLEVFQRFHENQPYSAFLVSQSQALPDYPEQVGQLEQEFEPPDSQFGAVFVDGCKSWYGTQYFLLKMAPHVHKGTIFLFQDYGWYTCFWIPLVVQRLADHFEPIAHVGSTYTFRLTQELRVETVGDRLPDTLSTIDKGWIDDAFAALFLQAHARQDTRALAVYTLQWGAALAYLGCVDEAKATLVSLLTQPWVKEVEPFLKNALMFPTYTGQRDQIPLFTEQNYHHLMQQLGRFTAKKIKDEKLAFKQQQIESLQDKLAQKVAQTEKIERQKRNLARQLQEYQDALHDAQTKLAALENSKFLKMQRLWLQVKRSLRGGDH